MLQVGFEPMVAVFERAKTLYVLDRVASVIGKFEPIVFFENWY
jgi:hypothetical protein